MLKRARFRQKKRKGGPNSPPLPAISTGQRLAAASTDTETPGPMVELSAILRM